MVIVLFHVNERLGGSCHILGKNKLNNHLLMIGFHTMVGKARFLYYGVSETTVWYEEKRELI